MVTITAPGVELKEIDLSFYDFPQPTEETQNVLITGFSPKGQINTVYKFTSDNTEDDLINTFGTPTTEAERYFFNTCSEAIKRDRVVLYAVRLPYYNTSTENYKVSTYKIAGINTINSEPTLQSIVSADPTLASGIYMKIEADLAASDSIALSTVEDYRASIIKPAENKFIIIDKTQEIYNKIPVDAEHMTLSSRYLLGVMPVVTTAPNALYVQKLIEQGVDYLPAFESIGDIRTSYGVTVDENLMVTPANSDSLDENDKDSMTLSKFAAKFFPTINISPNGAFERDRLKNIGVVVFKAFIDPECGNKINYQPVEAFAGSLKSDDVDPVTGVSRFIDDIVNTNSELIELYSNCFNSNINIDETLQTTVINDLSTNVTIINNLLQHQFEQLSETSSFASISSLTLGTINDIKDAIETLSVNCETLSSYGTSDKNTTKVVNNALKQIKSLKEALEELDDSEYSYDEIDMLYVKRATTKTLGFEEIDASEKRISFGKIYTSLDKIFEKNKNINEKQIDLVVDAGVSNIAQFMYIVNGKGNDVATFVDETTGADKQDYQPIWCPTYDPLAYKVDDKGVHSAVELWDICDRLRGSGSTASSAKDGATDAWKLVLKKYDDFCKTRKDCMFISDGLRPFCVIGNKKLVTPTNFKTTIGNSITPFLKYMTGKIDTSYGAGYCDWYQIVDPTSNVNMWMPPTVKAMDVYLDTTNNKYYWSTPAGINNGLLNPADNKSKVLVKDIAFNPTVEEAGDIYPKSWNYCTYDMNAGFMLEGQRTFQTRATAFDRVNVRRLFLYLERKTRMAAQYFIYESNNAYTRQRLLDAITPYFENAKINGGIADYRLQCDDKNNTPDTIDRNELHIKVAIKPQKAIEFIEISFVALRTGASFVEAGMED